MKSDVEHGPIRAARIWMDRLRSEPSVQPAPIVAADLERELGAAVHSCTLWKTNWRTRIYRLDVGRDAPLIVKQCCSATEPEVAHEFYELASLGTRPMRGFRVPRAVTLLPWLRAYVMEALPGRSLKAIFWDRDAGDDLFEACTHAGEALAELHLGWTRSVQPVPVAHLARDLAEMPGGFSRAEWATIDRALGRLSGALVGMGQLYLDFKASNILWGAQGVALIDAPEACRIGPLAWDVATFRRYLSWQMWKAQWTKPWGHPGALAQRSLHAFDRAYCEMYRDHYPEATLPPLLLILLQLQQTGQILALQIGKLRLATVLRGPLRANGHFLSEAAGAAASLPVLLMHKRWLIRALARELAEGYDPSALTEGRLAACAPAS